ncbi:MAG: magnesium transporter, partial [Clostridia bacterium]|nr:magnesium transporter [Clostridia bacterium]
MENEALLNIISKMLEENKFSTLKDILKEMNTVDIAQAISESEPDKQVKIFRLLPKNSSAEVFSYLDSDTQETVINSITNVEIHNLVEDMFIDDAVDFLEEVPANVVTRVLAQTSRETREIINKFLRYPEDSAGSIMTVEMAAFHESLTVDEAINELRRTAQDKESIETCYCIDSQRKLVGLLPLR